MPVFNYPGFCFKTALMLALFMGAGSVFAFYEQTSAAGDFELRGVLRARPSIQERPPSYFYNERGTDTGLFTSFRLLADAIGKHGASFEIHGVASYFDNDLMSVENRFQGVARSDHFNAYNSDNKTLLEIDRLNFSWAGESINLTIGRQPINLATTFYFSANDFFAPFSAESVYRLFKPGVDAFRLNKDISELSQFSFIFVQGYQLIQAQDKSWHQYSDAQKNSVLLRYSLVSDNFEWIFMGGEVRANKMIAMALQGELFEWLGLRFEGQVVKQTELDEADVRSFSLGLEHRWLSSLELRLEYFFNGFGSKQDAVLPSALLVASRNASRAYLGREYMALGMAYELSPLLQMQLIQLFNVHDGSGLHSLNMTYSLADEAELNLAVSAPLNEKTSSPLALKEFSVLPKSIELELRWYF